MDPKVAFAAAFATSAAAGALLVLTRRWHAAYTDDTPGRERRKVHRVPVPRVGGVAVAAGIAAGAAFLPESQAADAILLLLCGLPLLLAGHAEDVLRRIPADLRLALSFGAAALVFFALDARVTDLALPGDDALFDAAVVSLAFTIFALGGISHAFNIMDGLNGLAGLLSILVLGAIAWVAQAVGDEQIRDPALLFAGAAAGFLLWNWPRARLFLGDGGACFLGFLAASLAILLVHRNTEVSPWFALAVLAYPVCETLFSAWRRAVVRRVSPMAADGLHLHSLVYRRLVEGAGRATQLRNGFAALYVLALAAIGVGAALLWWHDTAALQATVLVFVAIYVAFYRRIVRFRAPAWLVVRDRRRALRARTPLRVPTSAPTATTRAHDFR